MILTINSDGSYTTDRLLYIYKVLKHSADNRRIGNIILYIDEYKQAIRLEQPNIERLEQIIKDYSQHECNSYGYPHESIGYYRSKAYELELIETRQIL